MTDFDIVHNDDFREIFQSNVDQYLTVIEHTALSGLILEEILYKTFEVTAGVETIDWCPGSHGVGSDITVNGIRLSVKSCNLPTKPSAMMEYSSYRTGNQKTIQEKIEFIDRPHYDRMLCLARRDYSASGSDFRTYSLREVVNPSKYSDMDWSEDAINFTGTHPAWKACIRKSRSDQLIVYVPPSSISVITEFTVMRRAIKTTISQDRPIARHTVKSKIITPPNDFDDIFIFESK